MATDVIKSTGRAFELLEYLDLVERPVGLSEFVERFGWPQSSLAALLKSLVTQGYLHHDRRSRTYAPSTRLAQLGSWVMATLLGDERAIPLVNHLRRATGETVVLGMRNDLAAQYVLVRLSEHPLALHTKTGVLRPLVHSGVGWALLSALPDDEIVKLARQHNLAVERKEARVRPDAVLERVAEVRRAGYAFSRDIVTRGAGMIAMLLPAEGEAPRRAVAVGGPNERLVEKERLIVQAIRNGLALYYPAPRGRTRGGRRASPAR